MKIRKLLARTVTAAAATAAVYGAISVKKQRDETRVSTAIREKKGIHIVDRPIIGGIHQYIQIRGKADTNPILLYLHGGPGEAMSSIAYTYQQEWESFFTVVTWDQRGCGLSDRVNGPLRLDDFVMDIKEVAEYLNTKLPGRPIVLFGQSWGSVIGSLAANRYPDAFAAYIGTGQVVNIQKNFDMGFEHAKACAKAEDNTKLYQALLHAEETNPKKYLSKAYQTATMRYHFTSTKYQSMKEILSMMVSASMKCPDLSIKQSLTALAGHMGLSKVYMDFLATDDFLNFSLDSITKTYQIPYILIEGDHDWQTPFPIAKAYFDTVSAPDKFWYTIDNAGHMVQFDNLGQLTADLREIRNKYFEQ